MSTEDDQSMDLGGAPEAEPNPWDYAAHGVVQTIEGRMGLHGNPDIFADTFAGMLQAYLMPLVASQRPVTSADALAVLALLKVARMATGGPSMEHFHDIAGYGILGEVHVGKVMAYARGRREAQEADERAKAEAVTQDEPKGATSKRKG